MTLYETVVVAFVVCVLFAIVAIAVSVAVATVVWVYWRGDKGGRRAEGTGQADVRKPRAIPYDPERLRRTEEEIRNDLSSLVRDRSPVVRRLAEAHTKETPKMCIPAPSTFHFRLEPNAVSKQAYASRDAIFDDLAVAYQNAIKAFYAAGCRYLQFDDTAWAYLCSQEELKKARDRGLDVDHLQDSYTKCINKALEAKPADMVITTHVCRGNFRSTFISSGGYEPVAESLLAKCNYDGYFLEYDDERSGDFRPLRFMPKDKTVVLGLISSKVPALESKDLLKRRIEEAGKFVDPARLALSPQCGFSSTVEGNRITEADEIAKLKLVVDVAREVWG